MELGDGSRFAQVAVLAQLGRAGGLFTYGVPVSFEPLVGRGSLVSVPFTNRQLQGIVYELEDTTDLPRVRDIAELLDPAPVVTDQQLRLAHWIADYYAAPMSDVLGAMIPPRLGRKSVWVLEPGIDPNGSRLSSLQRQILDYIRGSGRVPLDELRKHWPEPELEKAVASLVRRKLLLKVAELTPPRDSIRKARGVAKRIDHKRFPTTAPLTLSPAQRRAFESIVESVRAKRPDIFLLHGVTGSGKTEVYLQAIAETIRLGRQAVMMVPEISLTPQALERVAGRFPARVAILHSKLGPAERLDEWQRIRHGEVDVVVGPRSALFAPLANPGLIVVDEEHDPSYKQDASPRYHARDTAAVLGRLTGATVIFGSATPDVTTFHAAAAGRIHLIELPDRPVWDEAHAGASRPMPRVEVIDMRQELKIGNRSMFSERLLDTLNDVLAKQHQALLFLNRRGSATVVICRDCGFVAHCPNCDIPYTYHSAATRLICHRCDKRAVSPRTCPACHSPRIRYLGAGTQRVEEEVARLFPRARVLRWDRDVTGGKGAHERILQQFAGHEADILVGTQMIAKGLDFPLVTLVGVVSADTGLHMPDFRAPERSFQLLTQVAGRAGRASLPSQVIVQTYTPEHYAIQAAKDHDYHRFYHEEMSFRRSARYPPFTRLIRFVYSSEREQSCRQSAANLRSILERAVTTEGLIDAEVIGPAPCFVAKVKNRYHWQVIVRGNVLQALLDYVPAGWTIDVDPVDLL